MFLYSKEDYMIPEDAIRFRIIANSDEIKDQSLKMNIKKELEKELFAKLENANSKQEAEQIIKESKPTIENTLKKYNMPYNINYGKNYFPEKEFKGNKYDEGYYDSLVITLGEAKGENWWCVMYPPLCLLDTEEDQEPEYDLYIEKIISNFIS